MRQPSPSLLALMFSAKSLPALGLMYNLLRQTWLHLGFPFFFVCSANSKHLEIDSLPSALQGLEDF